VFSKRILLCTLLSFIELACQKKSNGPPPRYAVLRFENLSGDPALDWVGRAASETLSVSLAGALDGPMLPVAALSRLEPSLGSRPASAPGISTQRHEALLSAATRVISGYVERTGGRIRITASVEDVPAARSHSVSAEGSSVIAALQKLAAQLSSHPNPPPTSNETALRSYAIALESPVAAGADDLENAVRADPDFGSAWNALVRVDLARGDRAAAEDAIRRAREHKLDAVSFANLDLEAAGPANRIDAMRKLAALTPGDTGLLRLLAEAETIAGRFDAAAADWKKLTVTFPGDASLWNVFGYSLSYAGDYQGARAALTEYARIRPKDPNAYDSLGDLNYAFRKFTEAAANYAQASQLQIDFSGYGDLYKAAWAKFNAGDKAGADSLFAQFRDARAKHSDGLVPLFAADWLYRTGRRPEAFASLRTAVTGSAPDAVRANGYALLVIWDLLGNDRAQAAKDSLSSGLRITDAPMLIARFAALPSAPAEEWRARAERLIAPPLAAYRPMALSYALMLDGKAADALPIWAQIVKERSATDFFVRAVYAHLQGKPPERPLVPDPATFNQFLAVLD
jgi:Tfp pilus assembly protein PilF/TolB-like protein